LGEGLAHIHTLFWVLLVILYVIALVRFRSTQVPPKVLHHIMRLTFVLTLAVGIWAIIENQRGGFYHIKGTIALAMFGLMEVSLSRLYKNKPAKLFVILSFVLLAVIIFMGYANRYIFDYSLLA